MKIVTITMVNNEAAIIESFVRYNCNFVDKMIIIDNGCTDNTINILTCLIDEGYDIEIYNESLTSRQQQKIENKYFKMVLESLEADLIVPLDADEFLSANIHPRKYLENLALDKVYYVYWKWFVMRPEDNMEIPFVPERIKWALKNPPNDEGQPPITKVIVPTQLARDKGIKLTNGHHEVICEKQVDIQYLLDFRIAHFRLISVEQFMVKTYVWTIRDIILMEAFNGEAGYRNKLLAKICENPEEKVKYAYEEAYQDFERDIEYAPLKLEFCQKLPISIRYAQSANINIFDYVLKTGQEMAIKVYNLEKEKKEKKFCRTVLVYGELNEYSHVLKYFPKHLINVRAILCEDLELEFTKYASSLVVSKEKYKFFPFDYIVIVGKNKDTSYLEKIGVHSSKILTFEKFLKKQGMLYKSLCSPVCLYEAIETYLIVNGVKSTIKKVASKLQKVIRR